jgi:hypothetical protein
MSRDTRAAHLPPHGARGLSSSRTGDPGLDAGERRCGSQAKSVRESRRCPAPIPAPSPSLSLPPFARRGPPSRGVHVAGADAVRLMRERPRGNTGVRNSGWHGSPLTHQLMRSEPPRAPRWRCNCAKRPTHRGPRSGTAKRGGNNATKYHSRCPVAPPSEPAHTSGQAARGAIRLYPSR